MSKNIYLTRIKLAQFRSFASLDVELPPEPGVLVVHGSNGLGKSSLFDGLEWGLSDQIDHFRKARGVKKVGHYLARWREHPTDPTSVAMSFSDGETIERSLASPESVTSTLGGTVDDITSYLRAASWRQSISALPNYLLLTHILGQSTLSRLTHRDAAERFDILKEAAQSRDVEAVATAIHGRGNTVTVRAFGRRIEALEKEATRFGELLDQEERLWLAMQGSGAIDDTRSLTMIAELRSLTGEATAGSRSTASSIADDLDRLEAALDSARVDLRDQQARLSQATQCVETWRQHNTTRAVAQSALAETAEQLTTIAAERTSVSGEKAEAERAHASALAAAEVARVHLDRLVALQDVRRAAILSRSRLGDAAQPFREAESRLAGATTQLERAQRRSRIALRLDGEVTRIDEETDRLQDDVDRISAWKAKDQSIQTLSAALADLESQHPGLTDRLRDAEAAMTAAATDVEAQSRTLSLLRETATSLAGAVATIAATLPEDACDCPVCATHFGEASELRARVGGAAERLNPALLSQEEGLAASRRRLQDLQSRVEERRSVLRQIQFQRSELAAARDHGSKLFDRIAHLGDVTTDFGAFMRDLGTEQQRLKSRRARKMVWIQRLRGASGADLQNEIQRLTRLRDKEKGTRDSCARAIEDGQSTLDSHKARIQAIEEQLGLSEPLSGPPLGSAIDTARNRHQQTLDVVAEARSAADFAIERLRRIDASEAATSARRRELERQLAEVDAQLRLVAEKWAGLGFSSEQPTDDDVSDRSAKTTDQARDLATAGDGLERLRAGRRAWASQVTHRAALDDLREAIDAAPNSGRDEIRLAAEQLRDAKTLAATETREVKVIAQSASQDLLNELDDFNAEYIQPLDTLMKRVNQAILTDPRVGIDLQVKKKKIEQNAVKTGDLPSGLDDIDPVLIHSEGQMSALAVSLLCAASITFPWSRWPALILDDPMQHNDAIHTAAFADLVCNLVEQRDYQIFLSTHDQAQAEFLHRKCAARGIPCGVLSLLGTGRGGVETEFRPATARGSGSFGNTSSIG